jgi:cytochrome c553
MKTWLITVSVATALVCTGAANAASGDAKAGEKKSAPCTACHGPAGNSVVPMWPKLAGQQESYIIKQLHDFKSGARSNAQMTPQAAPLNDQDILDLAAYFSSQQQSGGTTDPKAVELGTALYRGGDMATGVPACSGCHTPSGMGLGLAKFPRLAGQHAQYVESTLKMFRDGTRANDPNAMMRGVAAKLTDKQITAIAQFVQGQAPAAGSK